MYKLTSNAIDYCKNKETAKLVYEGFRDFGPLVSILHFYGKIKPIDQLECLKHFNLSFINNYKKIYELFESQIESDNIGRGILFGCDEYRNALKMYYKNKLSSKGINNKIETLINLGAKAYRSWDVKHKKLKDFKDRTDIIKLFGWTLLICFFIF